MVHEHGSARCRLCTRQINAEGEATEVSFHSSQKISTAALLSPKFSGRDSSRCGKVTIHANRYSPIEIGIIKVLEDNLSHGVVKQIVDYVKSSHSAKKMACADESLEVLREWKQTTQFSAPNDWMFASSMKLGRQPISYTFVWETLTAAASNAGIGHVSSHVFRHTHRTWLDSVGTPLGVQQRLMRHADIRTTMQYGDALTDDMREAHKKVVRLALFGLNGSQNGSPSS